MTGIAKTPRPTSYAVTFTSFPSDDTEGYAEMAEPIMITLAQSQPGFIGMRYAFAAVRALGIKTSLRLLAMSMRRYQRGSKT